MKKIFWILIGLLVLTSVYATTDYSKYKSINLVYSLNSELKVNIEGNDAQILEAKATVKLFPHKKFEKQNLVSFDIGSEPKAETDMNDVLRYTWHNLNTNKLIYGLDARVKTSNRFVKINRKIEYPYNFNNKELEEYLKPTEFIDINEEIKNTSSKIIGSEDDYIMAIDKIAGFVKKEINYDLNTITEQTVQKSSWVLQNKEGVCDEITNLFISMLRSSGIPARFVSGTAYTGLSDSWGNHGWAEVFIPGFGWVSYDVTYGQYLWIDPSHLKLSHSYDSGESSVDYMWRVRDMSIDVGKLNINTQFVSLGKLMEKQVKIEVVPLYKEAGFGSYVPVQVSVSNLKSYYVSESISLVKAPHLLSPVNKVITLKPGETKELYWVVEIPDNLDEDYVFSALLEVTGSFGEKAVNTINIGKNFDVLDYSNITAFVYHLEKRQDKSLMDNLEINCFPEKKVYYSNEKMKINCNILSKGVDIPSLSVCLREDCKYVDLKSDELFGLNFITSGVGNKVIVAETKDLIKRFNIDMEIIEIPDIYVSDLNPQKINYNKDGTITFLLNSDFTAYDVRIIIKGFGEFNINKFVGEKPIILKLAGKDLINGINIKMKYNDIKGKEYTKDETYFIEIEDIPWWRKMFMWVGI